MSYGPCIGVMCQNLFPVRRVTRCAESRRRCAGPPGSTAGPWFGISEGNSQPLEPRCQSAVSDPSHGQAGAASSSVPPPFPPGAPANTPLLRRRDSLRLPPFGSRLFASTSGIRSGARRTRKGNVAPRLPAALLAHGTCLRGERFPRPVRCCRAEWNSETERTGRNRHHSVGAILPKVGLRLLIGDAGMWQ